MATNRGISDLGDLVDAIENEIKTAIEDEEKRLLEEKEFLQEIYTQVVGDFEEKTATDLTVLYTVALVKDLAPDLYSAIES